MRCFNSWVAKMAEILAGRTEQVCRDSHTTCSSVQRLLILTSLTVPGSTERICMADKSTVPIRLESRLVPSSGIGLQVCTRTYAAGLQTAPRLHATVLPRIRIRIRIRVKMCRVNATWDTRPGTGPGHCSPHRAARFLNLGTVFTEIRVFPCHQPPRFNP